MPTRIGPRHSKGSLVAVLAALLIGAEPSGVSAAPIATPPPRPTGGQDSGIATDPAGMAAVDLQALLGKLGDKAKVYASVALKFVCIEAIRNSDDPPENERHYDFMYVETQQQRYIPYRQKHTGKPAKTVPETTIDFSFPDSYSWTLMFLPDRQQLFHFRYVRQDWFSLRLAYIIEFAASLPFTSGKTIYEWGGRVWVDAENFNFLKVEAEPGNQDERLKLELRNYRQAPRFLIYPMARRPHGASYEITFLNEYQKLSLPDQVDYRVFDLELDGSQSMEGATIQRYTGYRFYDVDVRDKFLK